MRAGPVAKAVWQHYRRHPIQLFLLLIGLITGVVMVNGVWLLNETAKRDYQRGEQLIGQQAYGIISSANDRKPVDQANYISLRNAGFSNLIPVVSGTFKDTQGRFISIVATDPLAFSAAESLEEDEGTDGSSDEGSFEDSGQKGGQDDNNQSVPDITDLMLPPYQFWGSAQRMAQLGLEDGDRLYPAGSSGALIVDRGAGTEAGIEVGRSAGIEVRQIPERGLGHRLWTDIGLGQQLLGMTGKLNYIALMENEGMSESERESHFEKLAAALPPTLKLERSRSELTLSQMTRSLHLNLTAMGLLAWVVGIFIAFNAIHFSLQDRAPLFNQLRTLGIAQPLIARLLLVEWVVLALLTTLIAAPVSVWLSDILLPLLGRTLDNLYAVRLSYQSIWSGWSLDVVVRALMVSTAGIALAAAGPWWQFIKTKQGEQTLSGSAMEEMTRGTAWQIKVAQLGVLMVLFAAFIAWLAPGLYTGFLVIALLLLGAGFIVPVLFSKGLASLARQGAASSKLTSNPESMPASKPAGKPRYKSAAKGRFSIAKWPVMHWSVTELKWQMSRTHVAMIALVLALTANVGVNTMVNSFRQTVLDWLDQRLVADIYLRPQSETASLIRWLEAQPEVEGLLTQRQIDVRIQTASDFATDYANSDNAGAEVTRPDVKELSAALLSLSRDDLAQRAITLYQGAQQIDWQRFEAGEGILISQRLHLLHGLNLGDQVWLSSKGVTAHQGETQADSALGGRDSGIKFTVSGVYYDYGNPNPQLMVDERVFSQYWPQIGISGIGILLSESSHISTLMPRIRDTYGFTDRQMIDQQSMRTVAVAVFDQTFVATEALNLLTLLVSALGLACALYLLNERRRKALGVIGSMGVSKRRLYLVSIGQWASVGILCTLLALPFGIGLAWVLINLLNVYGFGWSYPVDLPWLRFVQLAALAGIVTSLTAVLALRRLHRWSIARQISEAE
ncbi:FtsX-like permease family protein [Corallincola platygyrae]|uniref:FtsX-like permease family protein n=1 Tax=Corallincola platygyrae TaxID=1193278 RepID=A0ABW4XGF3_9GAMM